MEERGMLKTSAAALLAIAMSVGLAHAAGQGHMHHGMGHTHMHQAGHMQMHHGMGHMHMRHAMGHMHMHHGIGHMHHAGRHVIPGCALGQPGAGICACGTAANHRPLLCHKGQWCHPSQACTM
jgi:hypothetical protein